jgi:pyruvate dehydrogenase E2 component (dihydrolipoamide acetyltransferase)
MSDIKALTIPKWGMAMEEGTLVNWLVNEGDTIGIGDEVAEIESSKIVNVMESHVAGTLRRKVAVEDEILPVGGLLAVVADADVPDEEIDRFIAGFTAVPQAVSTKEPGQAAAVTASAPAAEIPQAAAAAPATGVPAALKQGGDDSHVMATPHARRLAREQGVNLNNVNGSGRHGRITVEDIEQAVAGAGGALAASPAAPHGVKVPRSLEDDSHVHATPLARRLAKQWGINLHDCRASGSHGRVGKVDVEAARRQREGGAAAPAAATWAAGPGVPAAPAVEDIPMSGIRQTIARRLQESKSTIPHYRLVAEAEIDALLDLRSELNAALPDADITVNDLLIKACATALMQVPDCNVQLHGHTIRRFRDADIAVAVALEEGLMTPIVTAANKKGIAQISNEVRDLVTRAKTGTLQQHEFEGGSFTLSNMGMFGIKQFDAIINPPQCAILAVGKGEERVIVDQGEGAIATLLTLSLSLDHRVIDGATGARFMQALVRVMEHPGLMSA